MGGVCGNGDRGVPVPVNIASVDSIHGLCREVGSIPWSEISRGL